MFEKVHPKTMWNKWIRNGIIVVCSMVMGEVLLAQDSSAQTQLTESASYDELARRANEIEQLSKKANGMFWALPVEKRNAILREGLCMMKKAGEKYNKEWFRLRNDSSFVELAVARGQYVNLQLIPDQSGSVKVGVLYHFYINPVFDLGHEGDLKKQVNLGIFKPVPLDKVEARLDSKKNLIFSITLDQTFLRELSDQSLFATVLYDWISDLPVLYKLPKEEVEDVIAKKGALCWEQSAAEANGTFCRQMVEWDGTHWIKAASSIRIQATLDAGLLKSNMRQTSDKVRLQVQWRLKNRNVRQNIVEDFKYLESQFTKWVEFRAHGQIPSFADSFIQTLERAKRDARLNLFANDPNWLKFPFYSKTVLKGQNTPCN